MTKIRQALQAPSPYLRGIIRRRECLNVSARKCHRRRTRTILRVFCCRTEPNTLYQPEGFKNTNSEKKKLQAN